jgi:Rieske 2Fe-2S family protein
VSISGDQRVTLPARAYVEREVYEAELDEVFARSWIFVCPERTVSAPGSFATANVAGEPVAIVRGEDGVLRALSNVCRHRAMQILDGTGTCPKVLRCPYHGWTYRQDGQLAAVPEARGFADLDREGVRLPCFRVEALAGLVFVSLDGDLPPLAEWFGDACARLATLGIGSLKATGPLITEYPYNWKNLADNYLEGYHIPVGHPGLLRMLDYKQYDPQLGVRHAWISAPLRDKPSVVRRERLYQRLVRPMDAYPADLHGSWAYAHLFPGLFLDLYPDQYDTWQLVPLGPDRTMAVTWVFTPEQERIGNRIARRINWRFNDAVMDEDKALCACVQRGLGARTYERGVLNRNERAIAHYHDLLRELVPGIDDV